MPFERSLQPSRAGLAARPCRTALVLLAAACSSPAGLARDNPAGLDWQTVATFQIARTETTIGQFRRYAQARQVLTQAERAGGGEVYEAGWTHKPGWNWTRPFGSKREAHDDEPAVHLTHGEAQDFCRWAGGRLPTDAQWRLAAYVEARPAPPAPFVRGKTYRYPSGDSPLGAQCLADCGEGAVMRAVRHGAQLARGLGHARAGSTPPGVNGLHEMGGNAWEWVEDAPPGPGAAGSAGSTHQRITRGGSWWYGAAQMEAGYLQSKPADTTVVYIGFRCAREISP